METDKNNSILGPGNIWIISKGKYTYPVLTGIDKAITAGIVKEYRISQFARYMLNPNPIEALKKLVGCEIHYHPPSFHKIKEKIGKIVSGILRSPVKNKDFRPEVLISQRHINAPPLKDGNLESHFNKMDELLRPYDPILNRLSAVDRSKISDITGLCGDIDMNRSWLNLQGNVDEKINYVFNFISRDVSVILEKAHISDGLFDMGGFDFKSYDPDKSYRLIRFSQDGKPKCCVLGPDNRVQYWIEDVKLIRYMHLLEQSIQTDPKLQDSLCQCVEGHATPLKLFFNKHLEIDYSTARPPEIYKEVFKACNTDENERNAVMNSLKKLQILISFNYAPKPYAGNEKLLTSISVMHDIRALEPIKNNFPHLYSEINKRTSVTEAGRFYLLDSIRGYVND